MTPKKKAKKLVNNFYQPLGYLKCGVNNTIMWEHAKQSALIAVDEILNLDMGLHFIFLDEMIYYEEVKREIEKL